MATNTRRQAPPPPPPPATASVNTHPGKKRGSWLPEPEKEMPISCLPTAIAAPELAKTGKERGSWLLPETEKEKEREEKEKPLARLAPAIPPGDLANPVKKESAPCLPAPEKESAPCLPAPEKEGEAKEKPLARPAPVNTAAENLANPVKKTRRVPITDVPMTDEDRNKIKRLKELHTLGLKELQELREERDGLRKNYDELLFSRRCLFARLVNRIVFHQRDAAYVRHQLEIGLKLGDKLPEELKKARQPISMAIFMWRDMGRALELGLDNFVAEYRDPKEHRKRIQRDWNAIAAIAEERSKRIQN